MLACRQPDQYDRAPAFGWMYAGTEADFFATPPAGSAPAGALPGHFASPALQAMLLPRRAEGAPGVMVVLGEHCLRVSPAVLDAAQRCGELTIEVLQCVGLMSDCL